MDVQVTDVLNNVTSNTQSELILFFIIMTVVLVAVLLPLYRMMMSDRKAKHAADNTRQDKYIEREKQIIQVITANTEVMAGLKATLESSGAATNSSLVRLHDRMDGQGAQMATLTANVTQIQTTLDRSISNQNAMINGINKTLLIVDSLPHDSNFGKGGLDIEERE